MIPIGDDNRGRRTTPFVNYTLIVLNVLVFLYEVSLPMDQLEVFVYRFGIVPAEITQGVDIPPLAPFPIYLTILTSMFLHGGWAHLLGNMLFLWIFGDNVEDSMGHLRYLIFYLLGGIGAALAQIFLAGPDSTTPMIGASGAIAAVLGAYFVMYPGGLVRVLVVLGFFITVVMVPAVIMIGLWFLLQLLSGLATLGIETQQTGGVAFWAHVGGFVTGLVLVWVFRDPKAVERQRAARRGYRAFQRW
ncbi:rhomboid family intramembrane serine protease [Sphaerobacter thermophilus]|uniref:Rhomboid family protein n=1 Tax=Sphaerobacter thermophilus (strain ATCC 49802 / DSM 20745 / KCCM 41009 / NCIMB 13125 / S 6022) TaxID=479434 RepID=D1C4P5_SPHTD|nr:rhomboid family intramembrane serine protease [Sphaerobacter thermophilus]ACZ39212.1 Rhomboid family protein [Sphaerobacter thermophilus DSM 20745]